jgi:hypothetical protein
MGEANTVVATVSASPDLKDAIRDYLEPADSSRPRSTLHLRSAFQPGLLGTSQVQESHAGQALPCFYTLTAAISREQSGLATLPAGKAAN